MTEQKQKAWFARVFGRSLFSMIFGSFFEVKNNTASIVATALVLTLCYIVIHKVDLITDMDRLVEGVLNVIFVVVGYYFGSKQYKIEGKDDESE